MPARFDTSASKAVIVAASATSGNVSATLNVSATAANLYAYAIVYWFGDSDVTAADFTATCGGQAMTPVPGTAQVVWESNHVTMLMFYLVNPGTGPQSVEALFSGMPTGTNQRRFAVSALTYKGVASLGNAVTVSGTSANITVPSTSAQMFVTAMGCYDPTATHAFSAFNQTSRFNIATTANVNDPFLMGDASGVGPLQFTATAPGTPQWGAAGVGLLGLAPVFGAVGTQFTGFTAAPSFTHPVGSSDTALVVGVNVGRNPLPGPVTATVSLAGVPDEPMELLDVVQSSPYTMTYLFGLLNPTVGTVTVKLATAAKAAFAAGSVSYQGVTGFDTAVTNTYLNTTIAVASNTPANCVLAAHAVSVQPNVFGYNLTKRATVNDPLVGAADQLVLIGDAPGAPTVISAATLSSGTPNWGAIALNQLPAPVMLNVSTIIGPVLTSARLSDYRNHTPAAARTWRVPAANSGPIVTSSLGRIGPTWTQAADAELDYTLDLTDWLAATGDTIASVSWTPNDSALVVISGNSAPGLPPTFTDTTMTGWLTGGANGNVYSIIAHVGTELGRQYDWTFNLIINQT